MFTLIIEDKQGNIIDEYSFEEGEFVVGRSQSCDIVLPADNVSRRHARLYTVDGAFHVEDLNAANGVWVNGERIDEVTELPRSAQVRIGDFYLHIEGAAFARPLGTSAFARLVPLPGSVGQLAELSRSTTLVGRGRDCTVVIRDPSVSRIHAKFTRESGGRIVLEDLRSSNGSYVNEQAIDVVEVRHGDRLRFGTVAFSFELEGEAPLVAPPAADSRPVLQAPYRETGGLKSTSALLAARPGARATMLPQIAVVAVIALAVTGLVVLVGVAYDRWVRPAVHEAGARPAAAPAHPSTADSRARREAEDARKLDAALTAGRDAMGRRQWAEAEQRFRDAQRVDAYHDEPRRALNVIAREKRAGARFAKAEAAFAKGDHGGAIRQYRLIPLESVYRLDADEQLAAIAKMLEARGDEACEAAQVEACEEAYRLALSTERASEALPDKYAEVLRRARRGGTAREGAPSKERKR